MCTAVYNGGGESGIVWNDPDVGIEWPVANSLLSKNDAAAQSLRDWLAGASSKKFSIHAR